MANLSTAAGNNGVAGTYDPATRTVTGAYSTSNLSVSGTHAVRQSVVQTAAGAASDVYSETQNLRYAYSGVESDAPAITRT